MPSIIYTKITLLEGRGLYSTIGFDFLPVSPFRGFDFLPKFCKLKYLLKIYDKPVFKTTNVSIIKPKNRNMNLVYLTNIQTPF